MASKQIKLTTTNDELPEKDNNQTKYTKIMGETYIEFQLTQMHRKVDYLTEALLILSSKVDINDQLSGLKDRSQRMSYRQASEFLGKKYQAFYAAAERGDFPKHFYPSGKTYFLRGELDGITQPAVPVTPNKAHRKGVAA